MNETLPIIERSAHISPCGNYRHTLTRCWDRMKPRLGFVMLNPSTADADQDDQTIRVCMGRARRMGFGGISVGNLFQFRTTYPTELKKATDRHGPNWEYGLQHCFIMPVSITIAAWGDDGWDIDGGQTVNKAVDMICNTYGRELWAIALTKAGHPKHPARLGYDLEPFIWKHRRAA